MYLLVFSFSFTEIR